MIGKSLLAASVASGLITPAKPPLFIPPKPAIIKSLKDPAPLLAMPLTLGMLPGKGIVLLPFSLTYISTASNQSNLTTYTFTAQNVGSTVAPGNNRYIVVAVSGVANSAAGIINSMTIGGSSATKLHSNGSAGRPNAIFSRLENTLTAADIVVTFAQTQVGCAIGVFQIINPGSITPYDTSSDLNLDPTEPTLDLDLDIPTDGKAIAVTSNNFGGGTHTWSGLTEHYDTDISSSAYASAASGGSAGAPYAISVTQTSANDYQEAVAASWGP